MGWAIGTGAAGRDIGYGVPAVCDQPNCDSEIDRGVSYACGSFRNDNGCGLYFCEKHLHYGEDEYGDTAEFCDHCIWQLENPEAAWNDPKAPPYHEPKPDIPKWVIWKLVAPSWGRWRELEKREVKQAFDQLDTYLISDIETMLTNLKEDLEFDNVQRQRP